MLVHQENGDTLVEVMVAIAVMTIITVGTLSIMNKGIGEAQSTSERATVRTRVSEQVELLNYFRDTYAKAISEGSPATIYPASVWLQVRALAAASTALTDQNNCTSVRADSFYIEYNAAITPARYELKNYTAGRVSDLPSEPGAGLSIEARDSASGSGVLQPYVDLVVKACWEPVAGSVTQNLSTALRLYDK